MNWQPLVGDCDYRFKPGWWCSRRWMHDGPCALRPHFWAHPILWFRAHRWIW